MNRIRSRTGHRPATRGISAAARSAGPGLLRIGASTDVGRRRVNRNPLHRVCSGVPSRYVRPARALRGAGLLHGMRRLARPCLVCGTPTRYGPRCEQHALPARARASASDRGYGADHQRARRGLAALLKARGSVPCGYCGALIQHGQRWDAAHVIDGVPSAGYMIAHPVCNQRAKTKPA